MHPAPLGWRNDKVETPTPESLEGLHQEVEVAGQALREAREAASLANREETAARNRYNDACKKFDAFVAKVRSSAPNNTDWNPPRSFPVDA